MNRKKQIADARRKIAATWPQGVVPANIAIDMVSHIEDALDIMAEAHADHTAYTTARALDRRARRHIGEKLGRLRAAAEGAPTLAVQIDRAIDEAAKKNDHVMIVADEEIRVLSGCDPQDVATELAYRLLRIYGAPSKRKGRALSAILPATTANGAWCALAAIIYGKPDQSLFRAVRATSNRIKKALAWHKIDTPRRQNSRIERI